MVDVRPHPEGGYEIDTMCSTNRRDKRVTTWRTKGVVFSAGVLGTVELLLHAYHEFSEIGLLLT